MMLVKCIKCKKKYERFNLGEHGHPYTCPKCLRKKKGKESFLILIILLMVLPTASAFELCLSGFGFCNPELPQINPTVVANVTGATGPQGPAGPQGPQGVAGTNGTNGVNGTFTGILNTSQFYNVSTIYSINNSWLNSIYATIEYVDNAVFGFVPYLGATDDLNLGPHSLTASSVNTASVTATGLVRGQNLMSDSLTSGRIPYVTTDGLLIDSENLTYSSGTAKIIIQGNAMSYQTAINGGQIFNSFYNNDGITRYGYFGFPANGNVDFYVTNERTAGDIILSTPGNVGIGTTVPIQKLDVRGNGNFSGTIYINNNTDISTYQNNLTNVAFTNQTNTFTGNQIFNNDILMAGNKVAFNLTGFGYSVPTYKVLKIGDILNGNPYALSLGYDPALNTDGNFNGNEILIPNSKGVPGMGIIAPKASNIGYIGILKVANDSIRIGGTNYQVDGHMFVNTTTGNVGIGTTSPTQKLDVNGNVNISGNLSVKVPYAMFSDNTTQVIALADTAQPINFSTTEDNWQIALQGKQNITFQQAGDYYIDVSAIGTVDLPNKHVQLWLQKSTGGGAFVNVPRSNTKMELATAMTEIPLAVSFMIDLQPTDKIRFMMASDDVGSSLVYTTNTSYSPESPSIIINMHKIGGTT